MGVDVQRELAFAEAPEAPQGDEHLVADASHVEENRTIELSFDNPAF